MLCESQPPVSCAGAKAHSLSARALLLDALGTVARYATAPIASTLISHALGTVARYATAPIASSLSLRRLPTRLCICRSPQTTMKTDARSTLGEEGSSLRLTTTERRLKLHTPP